MNKIFLSALLGGSTILYALSPEQQVYSEDIEIRVAKNALSQKLSGASLIFIDSNIKKEKFDEPLNLFTIRTIKNKSELRTELNIFGSDSLEVGNFLSTIEGEFYENFQLKREKVYVLIKRDLTTATDELNESSLTESAIDLYKNDIKQFRTLYGDLFVSSIIYGNREFSTLQIDVLSPQEKNQIELYIDTLPSITTEEEFNTTILNLRERFRDTNLTSIREDENRSLPYLITLSPFSSFDEIPTLPTTEEQKIQNLQEYVVRDQEYGDILSKIDYVEDIQNRGDEFISQIYGESEIDNSLLEELKLETERQKSRLKGFARDCKKDISCQTLSSFDDSDYLRFPQEFELNDQLPVEFSKIALNSCLEHQDYFYQDFRDSNYTIEIRDRDGIEHNVSLFCLDMDSSSPDEYLPLPNNSFILVREENISIPYLQFNLDSSSLTGVYLSNNRVQNIDFDEIMRLKLDLTDSDFSLSESFSFIKSDNNSSKGYFVIKNSEMPSQAEAHQIIDVEESSLSHLVDIHREFLNHLDYKIVQDSEERLEFNSSNSLIYFNTVYGSGEPSEIINNGGIDLDVK